MSRIVPALALLASSSLPNLRSGLCTRPVSTRALISGESEKPLGTGGCQERPQCSQHGRGPERGPARRSPGGERSAGRAGQDWAGAGQGSEARGILGRVGRLAGQFMWSLWMWSGPRLETKWKQWKLWNASKDSLGAGPCTRPYGSGGDEDSCLNLF